MNRSILIAFIILVFILSSCQNGAFSQGEIDKEFPQDKQLLFFSDDDNIDREAVYYDALLDIRKEFPEEFENMRIITDNNNKSQYEVDIYPSLLVVKHEEIVVQIEGDVFTKEEIMKPVIDALSH
ncbi:hypothetical protein [Metabacillus sediminilitoris]|uniref:Small peptidoglycan-associated lipoprotein n=1 Tax=Metabacillus sediminilitoris TaxID=2567941 RepID=A0A4S4C7B9_9BACI|nr:hypothetical protein [Metabacillus sediminilitoris]QGQ47008.1 hypothetical protein GMB29_18225 [Metabacillus sediminilitoris]THF83155.1 hypothetical protein E6W99_01960 [Metabacillus sediminilitoris]